MNPAIFAFGLPGVPELIILFLLFAVPVAIASLIIVLVLRNRSRKHQDKPPPVRSLSDENQAISDDD